MHKALLEQEAPGDKSTEQSEPSAPAKGVDGAKEEAVKEPPQPEEEREGEEEEELEADQEVEAPPEDVE